MLKAAVLRRHLTDSQRSMMAAMYAKDNPKPRVAGPGRGKKKSGPTGVRSFSVDHPARAEAAVLMNVTPRLVARAAKVLSADPGLAKEVHAGKKKLGQACREVSHREKVERIKLLKSVEGEYGVIVIDPPWPYSRRFGKAKDVQEPDKRGMGDDRRAISPYPEMTMEELKEFKLPAAPDCILWLWTTNTFIREAFDLLDAWGFEYKTMLTWVKDRMGLGDWLRGQTEHCLLAVKGSPRVILTNQTTALTAPAREHSRKPAAFYEAGA
jgi:N6-adenosine-specific RNA methylase IME4